MIHRTEPTQQTDKVGVGSLHFHLGYSNGFKQPSVRVQFKQQTVPALQVAILNQACQYYLGPQSLELTENLAQNFGQLICIIQANAGLPIFDKMQVRQLSGQTVDLLLPMLFPPCVLDSCQFVMKLFNHYLQQTSFVADEKWRHDLQHLIAQLRIRAPQGSNSIKFLKAAHDLNIPWVHFGLNVFQYGHGKYARRLDSSFTDNMPHIGAKLANDKRTMTTLLFRHGFPVPEQLVVRSETEAIEQAAKLQYPVVMKPIDGSHGIGVYTNLLNVTAVKSAFQKVREHTQTILMEKHIPGKDYRLMVFNGKLIWAVERVPAFVIGNNIDTIEALITQHNQKNIAFFPIMHIKINTELQEYLQENQLTLNSIPIANAYVRLARIANISAGGTPVNVFDKVHPDTQRMAEAAAKLLKLDLVGIDFISPNIEKSYLQNAGKIIEINVQPQLGAITSSHLYKQILEQLIVGQGRIPIIVLFGKNPASATLIEALTNKFDKQIGIARGNKVLVNSVELLHPPTVYHAGLTVLSMPDIDGMIYCLEDANQIESLGLPFDQFDTLILLDGQTTPNVLLQSCKQTLKFAGDLDTILSNIEV